MTSANDILDLFMSEEEEKVNKPIIVSKKILTNNTKKKLLKYQEQAVLDTVRIASTKRICLNLSDTGVGKTYIAAATCKELGRRPLVICPKTLMPNWLNVLEYFDVEPFDVVNYDTLRNGKCYKDHSFKNRKKCTYFTNTNQNNGPTPYAYDWNLPADAIVIIDEAHKCKESSTYNGKMLVSTRQLIDQGFPVLLLSATICEKIADMKIPLFLFGEIKSLRDFKSYSNNLRNRTRNIKKRNYINEKDYEIAKENAQAIIIHDIIKEQTVRIKIKDLGNQFPENQLCAQQFSVDDSDAISAAYEEIAELMKELRANPGQGHLGKIQKIKQEIELRKVPIFIEQAQLYIDENKSVIIFVNYIKPLELIAEQLGIRCKIYGKQTLEQRLEAMRLFQSNEERIIICQSRAGGVGIDLHDVNGNHPRVSLINYPDNASDLLQNIGRAYRAGGKSPVLQRIIFAANVDYEKQIMKNINKKLANISAINDGDLDGYKYDVKRITRRRVKKRSSKKKE